MSRASQNSTKLKTTSFILQDAPQINLYMLMHITSRGRTIGGGAALPYLPQSDTVARTTIIKKAIQSIGGKE